MFGTGEIHRLRLKPMPGVTTGSTRIEFVAITDRYTIKFVLLPTRPIGSPVSVTPIDNYYGGTITIR